MSVTAYGLPSARKLSFLVALYTLLEGCGNIIRCPHIAYYP